MWLIFCSYAIISYHDVANALIPEKNVKVNVISNFENRHFRSDRPHMILTYAKTLSPVYVISNFENRHFQLDRPHVP